MGAAFCGLVTSCVRVAYRERRKVMGVLRSLLITGFGRILMAACTLINLFRRGPDKSMESVLTKRPG